MIVGCKTLRNITDIDLDEDTVKLIAESFEVHDASCGANQKREHSQKRIGELSAAMQQRTVNGRSEQA